MNVIETTVQLIVILLIIIVIGVQNYKRGKRNVQEQSVANGCASYNEYGDFVWIRK